ncbi:MAG TPA: AI-2E family transporter [Pyrinomonadaceae bacterium]|jgi:predicted PurR-regulated permease PerM|nr:AI-2E family transporter [Pyrinomonadaceae bacterium]
MKTVDDPKRLKDLTVGDAKRIVVYATATLLALFLFILLVGKVLVALLLGIVAGVYLLPVQEWLERRLGARAGSALITIALIVVPLVSLVAYGWHELSSYSNTVLEKQAEITDSISKSLSNYLGVRYEDTRAGLQAAFAEAMMRSAEAVKELREGAALLLSSLTIFFFTMFYVLTQRARLASYIKVRVPGEFLPFYEKLSENVGGALRGALWAVFVDQAFKALIILVCNFAFGVPLAVALALAAFLVGFFPLLGVWVVYVPVSIYLLVFRGEPASAAIYFGIGVLITIASSLFVRPWLASSEAKAFNFYWMLVALLAGVYVFGIPGIVLGPAILGFAKAIVETLTGDVRYETSLLKEEKVQQAEQDAADALRPTPNAAD